MEIHWVGCFLRTRPERERESGEIGGRQREVHCQRGDGDVRTNSYPAAVLRVQHDTTRAGPTSATIRQLCCFLWRTSSQALSAVVRGADPALLPAISSPSMGRTGAPCRHGSPMVGSKSTNGYDYANLSPV